MKGQSGQRARDPLAAHHSSHMHPQGYEHGVGLACRCHLRCKNTRAVSRRGVITHWRNRFAVAQGRNWNKDMGKRVIKSLSFHRDACGNGFYFNKKECTPCGACEVAGTVRVGCRQLQQGDCEVCETGKHATPREEGQGGMCKPCNSEGLSGQAAHATSCHMSHAVDRYHGWQQGARPWRYSRTRTTF